MILKPGTRGSEWTSTGCAGASKRPEGREDVQTPRQGLGQHAQGPAGHQHDGAGGKGRGARRQGRKVDGRTVLTLRPKEWSQMRNHWENLNRTPLEAFLTWGKAERPVGDSVNNASQKQAAERG